VSRREFITLLGGAAAWPLAAGAQQPALPVVGFLRSTPATGFEYLVNALRQGLNDVGFVEGRNVAVEYRWAENQPDRLPGLAADLVRRQVAAIVASGPGAVQAAKAATTTTPIIFVIGADPVRTGLVASLNRPGGNTTGVVFTLVDLAAKLLGLLQELVPTASVIAVLRDPNGPEADVESRDLEEAGRAIGRQILMVNAAHEREFNAAFETVGQAGAGGLLIGAGPYFLSQRRHLVALAGRHAVPTMYNARQYAEVGGLISYGPSLTDAYRRVGVYVGRILKGEKAGDLPVELASKFELVINLGTAKACSAARRPRGRWWRERSPWRCRWSVISRAFPGAIGAADGGIQTGPKGQRLRRARERDDLVERF
jgi:putative tryptophan/tyrosine transport system substrate-binding protein